LDYATYPAFAGLTAQQIDRVVRAGQTLEFAAGEHLLEAGQASTHLHFLTAGQVRVTVPPVGGGDPQQLALAQAPCVIGEIELFTGEPYLATVETVETCATLSMSYDTLRGLLSAEDIAILKMMFNVARLIGQRLSDMDRTAVELLQQRYDGAQSLKDSMFREWAPAEG